jgi:hypothetical protein
MATPIWRQAGQANEIGRQVSHRLRAGYLEKDETVWMFDNEIDWVMRMECTFLVPGAVRQLEGWVLA